MTVPDVPQPAITMRRATRADTAQLADFYQRCFADRTRLNDTAQWEWEFASQPGAEERFPFFVLDAGKCIEGGIGLIQLKVRAGSQIMPCVQPVNFFVNPSFKGLHALRLFRSVLSEAPLVLASYTSEAATPLVKRSGFIDFSAHYHAYHLPLRFLNSATSLTGFIRAGILHVVRRMWSSMLGMVVRLHTTKVRYHVAETMNTHWLSQTSAWQMTTCCVVKNADYLAWRYSSPGLCCRYIWQLRGDKPIALAVMHLDKTRDEAVLLDYIAETGEPWALLGLLAKTMNDARRGCAKVWITHTLSVPVERALRTLGCGWRQSPFGLTLLCNDAGIQNLVTDYRNWHVMVGDTDVY